jgi:hypothetical protein
MQTDIAVRLAIAGSGIWPTKLEQTTSSFVSVKNPK